MKLCVHISQSDQGHYVGCCPMLPGCTSRGTTPQEAEERLDEAIRGYMAAVNNFVPEQLDREVVYA